MEFSLETLQRLAVPLLLLLMANGAPVLARLLLAGRYEHPVDGSFRFIDGRSLLGASKTIRGLLASLLMTTLLAMLLGLEWWLGLMFSLYAMLGDMFASFCKRRLAIPPHDRAMGLDQVPEAFLPLWLLSEPLGLELGSVFGLVGFFVVLDLLLSPILYRWHLRLRPY